MRDKRKEIEKTGAAVVIIGTGDMRYAKAFVEDEKIPYLVLVDDDAKAAKAASVKRGGAFALLSPLQLPGVARALARGHIQHASGKRTTQLAATFVIGPGMKLHYEYLSKDPSDHAPMKDVLAALGGRS